MNVEPTVILSSALSLSHPSFQVHAHASASIRERHVSSARGLAAVLPPAHWADHGRAAHVALGQRFDHQRVRHSLVPPRQQGHQLEVVLDLLLEAPPPVRDFPLTVRVLVQLPPYREHGGVAAGA